MMSKQLKKKVSLNLKTIGAAVCSIIIASEFCAILLSSLSALKFNNYSKSKRKYYQVYLLE